MARTKGSKNKPKEIKGKGLAENTEIKNLSPDNSIKQELSPLLIKRGRGRPKGAKGKPKEIKETSLEIKRIKKEIKDLRAEKLSLPAGDKKRIELHRKIKEMKLLLTEKKEIKEDKIIEITQANTDKEPIIAEILSLQEQYMIIPTFEVLGISLYKYTTKQLKHHLERIKIKYVKTIKM
jgi:hypothetical protein